MSRILLVEDEAGLRLTLTDRLVSEGHVVETAPEGEQGLRRASEEHFDLLILDVMLPRKNGFDVVRELRQRSVGVPILMLTARGELADRVVGLKLGADDYLIKPFQMAELLARVEARLRTQAPLDLRRGQSYVFGAVRIDFRSAQAARDGQTVRLSAKEFQLLRYFVERRGEILSRDQLLLAVWGYNAIPTTRTVDVHVASLRRKLEANARHPEHILTLHGLGYKFVG